MSVMNRKMFANRDARTKLAGMGGILASSPEMMDATQRFETGGQGVPRPGTGYGNEIFGEGNIFSNGAGAASGGDMVILGNTVFYVVDNGTVIDKEGTVVRDPSIVQAVIQKVSGEQPQEELSDVDAGMPFEFASSTGVSRDGRTDAEILAEAQAMIAARRTPESESFLPAGFKSPELMPTENEVPAQPSPTMQDIMDARSVAELMPSDDARAERGFGRTAVMDGLQVPYDTAPVVMSTGNDTTIQPELPPEGIMATISALAAATDDEKTELLFPDGNRGVPVVLPPEMGPEFNEFGPEGIAARTAAAETDNEERMALLAGRDAEADRMMGINDPVGSSMEDMARMRIAEEDMAMAQPVPQPLGGITVADGPSLLDRFKSFAGRVDESARNSTVGSALLGATDSVVSSLGGSELPPEMGPEFNEFGPEGLAQRTAAAEIQNQARLAEAAGIDARADRMMDINKIPEIAPASGLAPSGATRGNVDLAYGGSGDLYKRGLAGQMSTVKSLGDDEIRAIAGDPNSSLYGAALEEMGRRGLDFGEKPIIAAQENSRVAESKLFAAKEALRAAATLQDKLAAEAAIKDAEAGVAEATSNRNNVPKSVLETTVGNGGPSVIPANNTGIASVDAEKVKEAYREAADSMDGTGITSIGDMGAPKPTSMPPSLGDTRPQARPNRTDADADADADADKKFGDLVTEIEKKPGEAGAVVSGAMLNNSGVDTSNMGVKERTVAMKKMLTDLMGQTDADEKEEFWMNMAMVGFGIASGDSPDAMKNIADGLLAGTAQISKGTSDKKARDDKFTLTAYGEVLADERAREKFGRDLALAKSRGTDSIYGKRKDPLTQTYALAETLYSGGNADYETYEDALNAARTLVGKDYKMDLGGEDLVEKPVVTNKTEFDALPSKTEFIQNGQLRKKP